MDLGCNEGELIRIFSRSPIMKLIVGVDKDSKVLTRASLVTTFLSRMHNPNSFKDKSPSEGSIHAL